VGFGAAWGELAWCSSGWSPIPMHASLQKSTALSSVRFTELSTGQRRWFVVGAHGIVGVIAGHQSMERARAILRIFPELSSGGVTLRNIWRPYHGTRQNRRWRYILKYLYLARDGKRRKLRGAQNIENWRGRVGVENWRGKVRYILRLASRVYFTACGWGIILRNVKI